MREVWVEIQQNTEAMEVGEATQGECKREERQGLTGAKTSEGHTGKEEPIQEKIKERQREQRKASRVGCLRRMVHSV